MSPDPAAKAELEPEPPGGLQLLRVYIYEQRGCVMMFRLGVPPPHLHPTLHSQHFQCNSNVSVFCFFPQNFALLPTLEPLQSPPPPQWTPQVRGPHLGRSRSGPDHLSQPQRNPDRRKQSRTVKGINRRRLPAPVGPPPGLPLPGRSPRLTATHSLQRATEASRLLLARRTGLAQ